MDYKIGDVVLAVADYDDAPIMGMKGIVRCFNSVGLAGVEFENLRDMTRFGHTLNGKLDTRSGWYVPSSNLKLYKKNIDPRFSLIGKEVSI
jgi:hypothetical protein